MLLRLQAENYYNSMIFNRDRQRIYLKPRSKYVYTYPSDTCKSISLINPVGRFSQPHVIATPTHKIAKTGSVCWIFGEERQAAFAIQYKQLLLRNT